MADAAYRSWAEAQEKGRAAQPPATTGPQVDPPPEPARSFAQLARGWAAQGQDPDCGGGVLPGADRAGLPPTQWAERGRTRSSAGGAGPEPKKPHVHVLIPAKAVPKTAKPSPKSKSHAAAATPTARERRFRTAHIAGPPKDHERYAADGLAQRNERLEKATPSQPTQ